MTAVKERLPIEIRFRRIEKGQIYGLKNRIKNYFSTLTTNGNGSLRVSVSDDNRNIELYGTLSREQIAFIHRRWGNGGELAYPGADEKEEHDPDELIRNLIPRGRPLSSGELEAIAEGYAYEMEAEKQVPKRPYMNTGKRGLLLLKVLRRWNEPVEVERVSSEFGLTPTYTKIFMAPLVKHGILEKVGDRYQLK